MKVADAMSKQIDHLRPTDKVKEAAQIFFSKSTSIIPVCLGKRLVGTLTERDIVSPLFFNKGVVKQNNKENISVIQRKIPDILDMEIKDIMDKKPPFVKLTTSLPKTLAAMNEKNMERLPVVDNEKKLVGIISKNDIFRTLLDRDFLFPEAQESGFISDTYYTEQEKKERLLHEIPDLFRVLKSHDVKKVLDVGCGNGDHSIELAKMGFKVTGVDKSSNLINIAKRRKNTLPKNISNNLAFINKEVDDFLFQNEAFYDAIIFLGDTLSYNPNSYRYLIKKCVETLSDNGIIIFQIINFEKALTANKRLLNFTISHDKGERRDYAFIEFFDEPFKNRLITKNLATIVSDGNAWKWSGVIRDVLAYTSESRIKSILIGEGMRNVEVYGSTGKHFGFLFREPFMPLKSDWLNIIAYGKKPDKTIDIRNIRKINIGKNFKLKRSRT